MNSNSKIIIEWETLKLGGKIYKNSLIDKLKQIKNIYIISSGTIIDHMRILLFIKKWNLNATCFYKNSLFSTTEEKEKKWILKIIKKIIDKGKTKRAYVYCDNDHFIIGDMYKIMPMYTEYIWHCKLSGLYEIVAR